MRRVPGPFSLAVTDALFPLPTLRSVEALFEGPRDWVRHQDHFYRCFIAEVDGVLPDAVLRDLQRQVGEVLELDLAHVVRVTAQRMEPHDGAERHTDRPLAGYESARLVVQLDDGVGGHFRAFEGTRVWLDRPPRPNGAVAFELCATSEHDVTACTATRRTVVFHFWHVANPPHAREALDRQLGGLSFAELPPGIGAAMTDAEATYDDAQTLRAGCVATLLHRWGRDEHAVIAAYLGSVQGHAPTDDDALAGFLVELHLEGFDRHLWDELSGGARAQWMDGLSALPRPTTYTSRTWG